MSSQLSRLGLNWPVESKGIEMSGHLIGGDKSSHIERTGLDRARSSRNEAARLDLSMCLDRTGYVDVRGYGRKSHTT